jgi:hypothetical protein
MSRRTYGLILPNRNGGSYRPGQSYNLIRKREVGEVASSLLVNLSALSFGNVISEDTHEFFTVFGNVLVLGAGKKGKERKGEFRKNGPKQEKQARRVPRSRLMNIN